MAIITGVGGPFAFDYVTEGPVVLRDIIAERGDRKGYPSIFPVSMLERIFNMESIEIYPNEPNPITYRSKYYYNSTLNKLFVKISTSPVPCWKPVVE